MFSGRAQSLAPLADRMRPRNLDEFLGQGHVVGQGRLLRRAILADRLSSCIFFGPPGCGKTTLANIIANMTSAAFEQLNAVTAGVADVRKIISEAESRIRNYGQYTYLLLDECHRWNKAQSDSILPAIEKGTIKFIGSTTENPFISMTPAIVSRCRVFEFRRLEDGDIIKILNTALSDSERGYGGMSVSVDDDAMRHIARIADGDARSALNALELAVLSTPPGSDGVIHIDVSVAEDSIQQKVLQMDESLYYDMLSAFCKSLRGSDSDAALAWATRLINAGVDPKIIARRMIAHASEDVGLANPSAMVQAVAAAQALEFNGLPEAMLSLTQAMIYICESPKSNSVVRAIDAAKADAERLPDYPVPNHLRVSSYKGAERIGHGDGYLYPHNFPGGAVKQNYRPRGAENSVYYDPSDYGYEARIKENRRIRREIEEANDPNRDNKDK